MHFLNELWDEQGDKIEFERLHEIFAPNYDKQNGILRHKITPYEKPVKLNQQRNPNFFGLSGASLQTSLGSISSNINSVFENLLDPSVTNSMISSTNQQISSVISSANAALQKFSSNYFSPTKSPSPTSSSDGVNNSLLSSPSPYSKFESKSDYSSKPMQPPPIKVIANTSLSTSQSVSVSSPQPTTSPLSAYFSTHSAPSSQTPAVSSTTRPLTTSQTNQLQAEKINARFEQLNSHSSDSSKSNYTASDPASQPYFPPSSPQFRNTLQIQTEFIPFDKANATPTVSPLLRSGSGSLQQPPQNTPLYSSAGLYSSNLYNITKAAQPSTIPLGGGQPTPFVKQGSGFFPTAAVIPLGGQPVPSNPPSNQQ